ncbi:Hypothetical predicted protein, partial [Paramuricea clavata]
MALAAKWQEEGKTDLGEFVANRGPKIVNEAIETARELNEAQERLKRANKTRIELLEESAASACADGCQGEWLSAAKEILVLSGIGIQDFSSALHDALKRGRGKYRNVYIYGPANCGKTFLLSPLKKIFKCFMNPASGTFAWLGIENAESFFCRTSFGRTHRRQEDLASHPLQRTVINMSARRLTPVEEDVLALGLNFAVVPRVLPKEEFVQRLEPKLYHMTNDEASNIRVQITEALRRATLPASNLTKNEKDALKNLRADKSIHILKADKGNATVILDRLEYDNKILALLNTSTYKELKRDPTATIERKICFKLSGFKKA